ncbi:MAG TPA: tryptophan halogenase family protein [Steroidobacteraceae bacterium]
MSDAAPKIVIVGAGSACWLAALTFARVVRNSRDVTVVETPDAAGEPEAEGTLPGLRSLHRILGLDERDLMRHSQATFKLGTEFFDAPGAVSRFFHSYGDVGAALDSVAFHHHWLRVRGDEQSVSDYCLAAVAARLSRFALPDPDPRSPLSTLDYGWHLDVHAYVDYLRRKALQAGVAKIAARSVHVELRQADGFIAAIALGDGQRVTGDLFIDCTGPDGVLIGQNLQTPYEDWTDWLPCDREISVSAPAMPDPSPCTRITAHSTGWHWRIPLQGRTEHGFIYSSAFLSDDEATAALLSTPESPLTGEPRLRRFASGRRRQIWNRNCIAIGEAAAALEPLESVRLHHVHSTLTRVIDLFPSANFPSCLTEEFNRLVANDLERVRDWLILHYKGSQRRDSPFWKACSAMSIPETLARKIELFASRGRVVMYDEESFPESSWTGLFIAQQCWPRQIDPRAQMLDASRVRNQLNRMKAAIFRTASALPTHREFIQRYCPTSSAEAVSHG